jgi:hypothetical protein
MNRGLIVVAIAALPAVGGMQALAAGAQGPAQIAHAECGACHNFYLPQLLPKESWTLILGHLSDHFGEDASLPADQVDQLRSYLEANAAERWDTRAANMFRTDDPQDPLRITATAFWRYRHHGIDPAVFKRSKVGAKSNCNACHGDAAAGLFSPQAIHIPEETKK